MEKQEFLEKLRMSLNGRIQTVQVTDTINYYEDYINTEIRKGKSPDEVMDALGDPRLIAKTIIQTQGGNRFGDPQMAEYQNYYESQRYGEDIDRGQYDDYQEYSSDSQSESYEKNKKDTTQEDRGFQRRFSSGLDRFRENGFLKMPKWFWTAVLIVVIILVMVIVFRVLCFLAPLMIVLAAVMFMVKVFRDWLN